jgi:outer membrane protein TolC
MRPNAFAPLGRPSRLLAGRRASNGAVESTKHRTDRARRRASLALFVLALLASGCVLAPRAREDERRRAALAGAAYETERAERALPDLPEQPGWRDLLRRAFLANGDLEAAYFDWKAALARIDIAGAYPNTNVSLGFSYLFSDDNLKAWNRTTLSVGFDPMRNLSFPTKVSAAGRVAFDEARAAGERFFAAKFDLQRRVLQAFTDYALLAEKRRIQEAVLALDRLDAETAAQRVEAGEAQTALLDAEVRHHLSDNSLLALDAEIAAQRAMLNALVARDAEARLAPPQTLPEPRPLTVGDERLFAAMVDDNPELRALARETDARRDGVGLARQQYIPDLNPFAGLTGSIEKMVGVAASIPATIPRIRAGVAEARAMLRASEARAAQAGLDQHARFAAALAALHDGERQEAVFAHDVLPFAETVVASTEQSYASGASPFDAVIESRRLLLDLRLLLAEARSTRERQLAELEALAGFDVETLGRTEEPPPDPLLGKEGGRIGSASFARRGSGGGRASSLSLSSSQGGGA